MPKKTDGGAAAEEMPRTPVADIIERMTVQELTELIEAAEAKRREKLDEARAALRAEVERRAAELGLSAGDLFAQTARQETTGQGTRRRRPRSDAGAKRAVAVRYRGPGGEEWSGRGRTPRWLVAQEAEGRNREEFAVEPKLGLP
jgi:DNA-binding protein H-NS